MYKRLKGDVVTLSGLAYVAQSITGTEEFTGAVELDFRDGGLRNSRPPIPKGVNRKELVFLLKPILPTKNFTGKLCLGANLGVINDIKVITNNIGAGS